MKTRKANPPLIAIVGETASGKSALAVAIAKEFNGEIICADSWTVYKGLDVGTAKPSLAERAEVTHHLIDIKDPDEGFNAAAYKQLAQGAIDEIINRGKLPIMVGGTGLYIDSILFDFSFLPRGESGQREELQQHSIPELLEMIKQQDIDLVGIDIRNKRRLIRLLETGGRRPLSSPEIRPNTLVIGLKIPRAELRKNIEARVEKMFRRGLKKEVAELVSRYGWETEALKGIGYREFQDYFNGSESLAKTKAKIVKSTLNLAKRQRTWFKRNRQIIWVDEAKEAKELVKKFLKSV